MKTILSLLLILPTSVAFAQSLKVEISHNAPFEFKDLVEQYTPLSDAFLVTKGNQKIESDSYGHWLKVHENRDEVIEYYLEYDHYKSTVEVQNYTGSLRGDKIASFKTKTDGESMHLKAGFSIDAKYVIALSIKNDQLMAYKVDLATGKVVVKDLVIQIDQLPSEIHRLSATKDAEKVYVTGPGNPLFVIDMNTQQATNLPFEDYGELEDEDWRDIFPSLNSEHLLLATRKNVLDYNAKMYFFDTNKKKIIHEQRQKGQNARAFFITASGEIKKDFSSITIDEPGIGVVISNQSLMVFDQDGNYFTSSTSGDPEEEPDVLQYVSFNGEKSPRDPQPDLIPIITDVLGDEKTALLFEEFGSIFQSEDPRKQAYQLFESTAPYSEGLLKAVSTSYQTYIREYMGEHVVKWINNTEKMTLAEAGKEENINRGRFVKAYAGFYTFRERYERDFGLIFGSQTESSNAQEKLKPLEADLYYMTPDELIASGNKSLGMVGSMGEKAALLAITFYEVAAEKEPTEPVHEILIGNAYANANDYDNALAHYNKALAIRPDYPLALFGMTKTSFMPVQKGQKSLDINLAKSIIANADRFLAVAPADYVAESKSTKTYRAICQLFIDNQALYTAYNLATSLSSIEKRTAAISELLPKVKATGNSFLTAYLANINGFDYIKVAESKSDDLNFYKQAASMLSQSVNGGVYDQETYYEWARVNINYLENNEEGMRIVAAAQKAYPDDKNFGYLVSNEYFNKGRDLYLKKSYASAIPWFEKYMASARKIVPKAYDYLGFACYRVKKYGKAATNLQLLKDKEEPNTLLAYYSNFDAVLAYAKNPSGTAPSIQDNAEEIDRMEDHYMKGMDLSHAGQKSEGLKMMEAACTYYDKINYDYGQAVTHSGVGVAHHRMGDTSKAKAHYKACIDAGAQSSTCYNNLAVIFIGNDDISEAKSIVMDGLRKYPNASDLKKTKQYLYQ